jgi:YD repeat-containing protein
MCRGGVSPPSELTRTQYGYDAQSKRLKTVTAGGQTFTYYYKDGTDLIERIEAPVRHGPFDMSKYTPIMVEQTQSGGPIIMDGMTRVTNAMRSGITKLEAYVFKRS